MVTVHSVDLSLVKSIEAENHAVLFYLTTDYETTRYRHS